MAGQGGGRRACAETAPASQWRGRDTSRDSTAEARRTGRGSGTSGQSARTVTSWAAGSSPATPPAPWLSPTGLAQPPRRARPAAPPVLSTAVSLLCAPGCSPCFRRGHDPASLTGFAHTYTRTHTRTLPHSARACSRVVLSLSAPRQVTACRKRGSRRSPRGKCTNRSCVRGFVPRRPGWTAPSRSCVCSCAQTLVGSGPRGQLADQPSEGRAPRTLEASGGSRPGSSSRCRLSAQSPGQGAATGLAWLPPARLLPVRAAPSEQPPLAAVRSPPPWWFFSSKNRSPSASRFPVCVWGQSPGLVLWPCPPQRTGPPRLQPSAHALPCPARRLKVEELEGERSRLEESKKQLETQLERLTLMVSAGVSPPPCSLLRWQGCGSRTCGQGPTPTRTPLTRLPGARPESHREGAPPPALEPQPVCA